MFDMPRKPKGAITELFIAVVAVAVVVVLIAWPLISAAGQFSTSPATPVVYRPDLVIKSVSLSPTNPIPGANVTISVTVKNIGNGPAGSSATRYTWPTAPTSTNLATPALAAGAQTTLTASRIAPSAGIYTITAIADMSNQINESDETNNVASTVLQVVTPLPDLTIISFTVPSTVTNGQLVTFYVTVKNIGNAQANNIITRAYDNTTGQMLMSQSIPSLAPGSSQTLSQGWNVQTTTGVHALYAFADATNSITESNENNNKMWQSVTVVQSVAKPDLTITNGYGNSSALYAVVNNQGNASAANFTVNFWDVSSNTSVGNMLVASLASGATTTVSVPFSGAGPGDHNILATVDYYSTVAEFNEANNVYNFLVTIVSPLPDLTITSASYSANTSELLAVVKNQGTAQALNFTVNFWDNTYGSNIGNAVIPSLATGATTTVSVPFANATPGAHMIKVTVDSTNVVTETSETNNIYYTNITV